MHSPASSTGRPRRAIGIVAGAMALLATASCATNEDIASYPCPFVGAVRELSYTTKFEGESQDLSDTLYEAKVDQVLPAVNCIYENDDGKQAIVYDIQVKFLAQRGPKEHEGIVKFNYFVGIGGPGGQILKREVFDSRDRVREQRHPGHHHRRDPAPHSPEAGREWRLLPHLHRLHAERARAGVQPQESAVAPLRGSDGRHVAVSAPLQFTLPADPP